MAAEKVCRNNHWIMIKWPVLWHMDFYTDKDIILVCTLRAGGQRLCSLELVRSLILRSCLLESDSCCFGVVARRDGSLDMLHSAPQAHNAELEFEKETMHKAVGQRNALSMSSSKF